MGELESCWQMLLTTLRSYAVPPATALRNAQKLWRNWAWPSDNTIQSFHTLLRRTLMACERNHIPKAEHEVVLRYLELLPTECAL